MENKRIQLKKVYTPFSRMLHSYSSFVIHVRHRKATSCARKSHRYGWFSPVWVN